MTCPKKTRKLLWIFDFSGDHDRTCVNVRTWAGSLTGDFEVTWKCKNCGKYFRAFGLSEDWVTYIINDNPKWEKSQVGEGDYEWTRKDGIS